MMFTPTPNCNQGVELSIVDLQGNPATLPYFMVYDSFMKRLYVQTDERSDAQTYNY